MSTPLPEMPPVARRQRLLAATGVLPLPLILFAVTAFLAWQSSHEPAPDRIGQAIALTGTLAAMTALVTGTFALLTIERTARHGLHSREALASGFDDIRRVLPRTLKILIVAPGAALFAIVGHFLWQLGPGTSPDDRAGALVVQALILCAVTAWAAVRGMRALREANRVFDLPLPEVFGLALSRSDAPGLFTLVDDICREVGAERPDVIVAGSGPGFFVLDRGVHLRPSGDMHVGRVLHVDVAGMAVCDAAELRAVLAHEFAHFAGDDTVYSSRFLPLYNALASHARAMAAGRSGWGSDIVDRSLRHVLHPPTALAIFAVERFDDLTWHWSRRRELEADRIGARASSPQALASALLRLTMVGRNSHIALANLSADPDGEPADLPGLMVALSREDALGDPRPALAHHQQHPRDSHPPTLERIRQLGVAIDDTLLHHSVRPVTDADLLTTDALFTSWTFLRHRLAQSRRHTIREARLNYQAYLRDTAEAVDESSLALFEAIRGPMISTGVLAAVCAALGGGAWYSLLHETMTPGTRAAMIGLVAAGAAGLVMTAIWMVRLWRGRHHPYLVLNRDGLLSRGWTPGVPWDAIQQIEILARNATHIYLVDDHELPRKTGVIRRLNVDRRLRRITLAMRPRGMDMDTYHATVHRYLQAAAARRALTEGDVAPDLDHTDD